MGFAQSWQLNGRVVSLAPPRVAWDLGAGACTCVLARGVDEMRILHGDVLVVVEE